YCEEAGERYVQAAEKLVLGNNPSFETRERNRRLADVTATRALLKAPGFTLAWDKVRDLTEDRDWHNDYRITPPPGLAIGYPMLRIWPLKAPLKIADSTLLSRLPIADFAEKQSPSHERRLPFGIEKRRTDPVTGVVHVDLLYRGQVLDMST